MLNRRLLALSTGVRAQIVVLVLLGLTITATYVGQGLLMARIIGSIITGNPLASITLPLIGALVLQLLRGLLIWTREERSLVTAGVVKERIRQQLYARLLDLGPGYVLKTRTGQVTSTFVDGVEALERYVGSFIPQMFASLIGAVAIVGYIAFLDPVVGLVVLASAVLVPLAPILSRKLVRPASRQWWELYRRIFADNLDAIQGMSTLKAFAASRRRGQELHDQAETFSRAAIRMTMASVLFTGTVGLAESAGTALSVGVGAFRLAEGALEMSSLLIILMLSRECFRPLHDLQIAFHQSYSAVATAQTIFEVLDAPPQVQPPSSKAAVPALSSPPHVRFEQVSFRYRPGTPLALDRLSFEARPGETIALVGRSGAGKSTVVSLLLRFFDPESGLIRIGDAPIGALPVEQLRSLIAVVAQDTYLFHGTIRRNLELARPGASEAELEAAARAARAHDFITRLPDGYDTLVGERGQRLSGGERQRIAIARALLKDAPILILDEATSAIDTANEAEIQAALERLSQGRTTIVIAHRLSTVRHANRIVVLDRGIAVESGTHLALLDRAGVYAQLVATQEGAA